MISRIKVYFDEHTEQELDLRMKARSEESMVPIVEW